MIMVRKAGTASVKSLKLMRATSLIMRAPTMIRAGAVAQGGTRLTRGEKIRDTAKRTATVTAVRPVRPPWAMPAALST